MVLLSAQRRTVPEIVAIFAVKYKTVRKWLRRFDAHGPAGLYDELRSGRPRKLTDAVRDRLVKMIQQDPQQSERSGHVLDGADAGLSGGREARRVSEREQHPPDAAYRRTGLGSSPPGDAAQDRPGQGKEAMGDCPGGHRSGTGGSRALCRRVTHRTPAADPGDVALAGRADLGADPGQQSDPLPVRRPQYPQRPVELLGARATCTRRTSSSSSSIY